MGSDGDRVVELCFNNLNEPWIVYNDPIIQKNDGFNCGPIACLKVLELYGFIPTNSIAGIAQKKYGYRGVVMPFYQRMLEVNEGQLKFTLGKTTIKKINRKKKKNINKEPIVIDDGEDNKPDAMSITSNKRTLAMEKKNKKQQESAKKAMKKCGNAAIESGVAPGSVVSLQVDYRTHSNP